MNGKFAAILLGAVVTAIVPTPIGAETSGKEEVAEQRAKDITFDDIKFHMDDPKGRLFKRSMLTEKIEKLDGRNLRVRGFILPPPTRTLSSFVLTRDNKECCFGPGAALYDAVIIEMEPGLTTEYTTRPVTVEGRFSIKEWIAGDGKHLSIYYIRAKAVK
jgi:hypothetical protein